jgi:hypothetical protein
MAMWHDRVVRRLAALEAQESADRGMFMGLFTELNDQQSRADGERVVRNDKGGATVHYKGDPVFSFNVSEGEIIVVAAAGETVSLKDREQALIEMADLMARVVRKVRADAEHDHDERTRPLEPLYPA